MRVIVMSGCSGTGKSFHAKKLCAECKDESIIISADDFFVGKGGVYAYDKAKVGNAHAAAFRKFIDAMNEYDHAGSNIYKLIVVDNTHCNMHEVFAVMIAAASFGYEAEIITFRTTADKLPLLVGRNNHGCSLKTIQNQFRNLSYRVLPKRWKNTNIEVEI